MRVLGNILDHSCGLAIAIGWALVGLILCISIIGIPFGIQGVQDGGTHLDAVWQTVRTAAESVCLGQHPVGGAGRLLDGSRLSGAGVLNCITIIGIPFGIQSFKMAKLALGRLAH